MNLVFTCSFQKSGELIRSYQTTYSSFKLIQLCITKTIINNNYGDRDRLENILISLKNKNYMDLIEYHNENSDERYTINHYYSSQKADRDDEAFMERMIESFIPTIEEKLNKLLVQDILL